MEILSNVEIFGKVQGVYFRDNTVRKALELDLKGVDCLLLCCDIVTTCCNCMYR